MRRSKMTKAEALREFREFIKPQIPKGDVVWLREAWNNYTDSLCEDRRISASQYETWSNPY